MKTKTQVRTASAVALRRVATLAAVLLTFCLVFMMPVGAAAELPAAVDGVITLTNDVTLSETWRVSSEQSIILDLAGHTISQEKACAEHYSMIENSGSLTIIDRKGGGKISLKDTGAGDSNFGWGSYTIVNKGTLVVGTDESQEFTIEHLGEQNSNSVKHMYCALQLASGSTTINKGTISTPTYRSIRLINGDLTINGGTFNGQIWVQNDSNNGEGHLTINDGTFSPCGADGSSVFIENQNAKQTSLSITDGKFTTKVGATAFSKLGQCITGGTFTVSDATALKNIITALKDDGDGSAETRPVIQIAGDIPVTEMFEIKSPVKIVGVGETKPTITGTAQDIFRVHADATFENLKLVNTFTPSDEYGGRCINTRVGGLTVNINNCELIAETGTGNTQPLTICSTESEDVMSTVKVVKTTINAGNIGYGIITFSPVDLDITDSKISGYNALYFQKATGGVTSGSKNSVVTVEGGSTLAGKNTADGEWNNFGVVVFEETGISLTLDASDVALSEAEGTSTEGIFVFNTYWNSAAGAGNTVIVNSGVSLKTAGENAVFVVNPGTNSLTINAGVTSTFPIDSSYLANSCVCLPEGTGYKVVAKTYKITATEKVGFDSVKVGYSQPEPQTVTITNDCNVPVKLDQPTSANYVIGTLSATELAPQGTATFTIQPVAGLAVGNYADTITVTTNTSAAADVAVSFLVYQPSSGGSSTTKPEEPVEHETPVEPENPTEEPEAGEPSVETEVTDGGEVLFEAPVEPETPGADTPSDEPAEPAEPTVTGVELPAGTDSEVAFIPVSEKPAPAGKETQTKKVFEINVPKYEKGKPATVKFTMTVAELAADGKTAADVALWHQDEETGEWTKLVTTFVIIDGVVYFEAITFDFSPFAIVYEDVSAPTEPETPEQPTESPAPILAVLAGLGAAVVLRRK